MINKRRFIDVITVLSCLAVVTLHTNGICHASPAPTGALLWKVNFWHHLFIFGAPVFFMISGATLMGYRNRYDTRTFLLRRFRRSVVPFIFWSLIAFLVHAIVERGVTTKEIILLPLKICACDYMSIYWFFMTIFMAYLFMPALSLMAGKKKLLFSLIAVWFVVESMYPYICRLIGFTVCGGIAFPYVGGGVIYMLIGYCLCEFELDRRCRIVLYALGVLAFAVRFAGAILGLPKLSGGCWAPWCIIYSSAVFYFVSRFDFRNMPHWLDALVDWIKPHTLGVYLIHGFVTDIAAAKLGWPIESFLYRVITPVILIAVCVLISSFFLRSFHC